MDKYLLGKLLGLLISRLSTELLREFGQKVVSWAKAKVLDSETKTDDKFLLPILDMMDEILEKSDG